MNKKYYDGFDVISILFKNLEPRKAWKVLEAFAEYDGVDAVEVVRCKDCKWYYRGGATCMFWDGANGMCGDDFCGKAERAEE